MMDHLSLHSDSKSKSKSKEKEVLAGLIPLRGKAQRDLASSYSRIFPCSQPGPLDPVSNSQHLFSSHKGDLGRRRKVRRILSGGPMDA